MAFPPDSVSVLGVRSSMHIKTSISKVSNVLSLASEPSGLLNGLRFEWSHNSCVATVEPVSSSNLNRNSKVSVSVSSDGSSSPVENEPLLNVAWIVVSDSQTILV